MCCCCYLAYKNNCPVTFKLQHLICKIFADNELQKIYNLIVNYIQGHSRIHYDNLVVLLLITKGKHTFSHIYSVFLCLNGNSKTLTLQQLTVPYLSNSFFINHQAKRGGSLFQGSLDEREGVTRE